MPWRCDSFFGNTPVSSGRWAAPRPTGRSRKTANRRRRREGYTIDASARRDSRRASVPSRIRYETGALRKVHVRGRSNAVLLHAAAFNLALILRSITKAGTPKGLADLKTKLLCALWRVLAPLPPLYAPITSSVAALSPISTGSITRSQNCDPVRQESAIGETGRPDTAC